MGGLSGALSASESSSGITVAGTAKRGGESALKPSSSFFITSLSFSHSTSSSPRCVSTHMALWNRTGDSPWGFSSLMVALSPERLLVDMRVLVLGPPEFSLFRSRGFPCCLPRVIPLSAVLWPFSPTFTDAFFDAKLMEVRLGDFGDSAALERGI